MTLIHTKSKLQNKSNDSPLSLFLRDRLLQNERLEMLLLAYIRD